MNSCGRTLGVVLARTTRAAWGSLPRLMSTPRPLHDPRIPDIGSVPQAMRMFRVNWIASELRSPSGIPLHTPDYVSRLGRVAHLVDVRTPEELTGALGYIPGSVWVPREEALERLSALDVDTPVVLVSRGGERAGELAKALESRGHRFVAALMGASWRGARWASPPRASPTSSRAGGSSWRSTRCGSPTSGC